MVAVTMNGSLCGNTLGKALEFPTKNNKDLSCSQSAAERTNRCSHERATAEIIPTPQSVIRPTTVWW